MKRDDLTPDREVSDALRRLDRATPASQADVRRLVRRIVAKAEPLLEQRRYRAVDWWEYPAIWARTLIPLGIAAALVAASFILWARGARLPVSPARAATASVATRMETADMLPQQVLYALVAPVEQGVVPSAARHGK